MCVDADDCDWALSDCSTPRLVTPPRRGGLAAAFNQILICQDCSIAKNSLHPFYWLIQRLEEIPDDALIEYLARVLCQSMLASCEQGASC